MTGSEHRVIAQDILSGKFLHWDLEVSNLSVQWQLSGPQAISGNFPVELRELRDLGMHPWGTWVHVEEGGEIRASAILQPAQIDADETLTLDAVGPTGYLKGQPYVGAFLLSGTDPATGESGIGVGLDPADIMRDIWREAQAYTASQLGVTVVGSTPVRIGTPARDVEFDATNPDTGETETVAFEAGPYKALSWWENPDLGTEFDNLAKRAPLDYRERQAWNPDKTAVLHWIELGHPRLGRRNTDVRFSQEENLLAAIGPEEPDDRYASEVIVLGKGEGMERRRGGARRPLPGRLRRVVVVDDKSVPSNAACVAEAWHELDLRQALADVSEATAQARDDNARLGAYDVGDDVPVAADVPWLGELRLWQRVMGLVWSPESEQVKLSLRAADSFNYGQST